ncbi:hypothetical protein KSS87_008982 [Heliosperma pusillum]|nr:hypothetical protein KSS87_008982 [Heliosperma pusillum]
MAGRVAMRFISRRFSSGGKMLSEEEKAAENVYIKKMEKEKLEKAAHQHKRILILTAGKGNFGYDSFSSEGDESFQGPKPAETPASGSGAPPVIDAAKTSGSGAKTSKVSTDKDRNYAVVAGTLTILAAVGWYMKAGSKKSEEVQD